MEGDTGWGRWKAAGGPGVTVVTVDAKAADPAAMGAPHVTLGPKQPVTQGSRAASVSVWWV